MYQTIYSLEDLGIRVKDVPSPNCIVQLLRDGSTTSAKDFAEYLARVLETVQKPGHSWVFSCLGELSEGYNLTVLQRLTKPGANFAFALGPFSKDDPSAPPGWIEIALSCKRSDFEHLILDPEIELDYDFMVAGWLVPDSVSGKNKLLKFRSGCFVAGNDQVEASFCSRIDFDSIYFFFRDSGLVSALQNVGGAKEEGENTT